VGFARIRCSGRGGIRSFVVDFGWIIRLKLRQIHPKHGLSVLFRKIPCLEVCLLSPTQMGVVRTGVPKMSESKTRTNARSIRKSKSSGSHVPILGTQKLSGAHTALGRVGAAECAFSFLWNACSASSEYAARNHMNHRMKDVSRKSQKNGPPAGPPRTAGGTVNCSDGRDGAPTSSDGGPWRGAFPTPVRSRLALALAGNRTRSEERI